MIKLKDLLIERGYRPVRSSNGIRYQKKVEENILDVYTKKILLIISFSGMNPNIYRILDGKTLRDYINSLGFDYSIPSGLQKIALIKNTNFSNTQLSNKAAKSLSDFLDIYEKESMIEEIREKIQDMIDQVVAGDGDLEEVKKYNEIKDFAESKGLTVVDNGSEIYGDFKTSSYNYSFRISSIYNKNLAITITMKDNTYVDYFSKLTNIKDPHDVLDEICKILWKNKDKYGNLFPPFLLRIFNYYPALDIFFKCNDFEYWDDEDRLNFIKNYIELFTDPNQAKDFFELLKELIEDIVIDII